MRAVEGSWRQMTLPPLSFCITQGQLDDLKFFGKPKLGLDAVGGTAAAKLADALVEVHMLLMSFACFSMFLERLPALHRLTYGRHWSTPCTNALVLTSIRPSMQGGSMVCYGCASGKSPAWPWQSWVFREQQVSGFNLRAWLARNPRKVCTAACHLHRNIDLQGSA
jgi:hypothetical protein